MIITSLLQETLNRHGARALELLQTYWFELTSHGDIPLWSDVDPRAIQDALEHAFLAERFGCRDARLRIAGGGVQRILGQHVLGGPFSLALDPGSRPRLYSALETCGHHRAPCEIDLRSAESGAPHTAKARLMIYPLRDTDGHVSHFLGAVAEAEESRARGTQYRIADVHHAAGQVKAPTLRLVVDNT
ncbi:PAS domain-containing protein [Marivita sp. XM-24bin2]|uniref:PAS domain-containing protein n=1 Tax=unclassified Marivita TaxID=2632480 RepID=UPI000D7A0CDF|nr:PAS domain-containing protein [Marivita sp. XM-24bin2]MCR9107942.1 PAS domain-containing protein [Paracoccaceae bacterium]PWL35075.1 MAG: hypothetical protein DCO97_11355 [Marivita sp. XM-24bin2]